MRNHKSIPKDNTCIIDGCDNPVLENSGHPECRLCRGSRWYWDQKTPAQVLERRRKLTMYKARLIRFFADNGKSKD